MLSRAIQPIGLALYAEAQIGPEEAEIEAKVLMDVEKGPVVVAVDLVGEWEGKRETELADDGTLSARLVPEFLIQGYVAASYELKSHVGGSIEVRRLNASAGGAGRPDHAVRRPGALLPVHRLVGRAHAEHTAGESRNRPAGGGELAHPQQRDRPDHDPQPQGGEPNEERAGQGAARIKPLHQPLRQLHQHTIRDPEPAR